MADLVKHTRKNENESGATMWQAFGVNSRYDRYDRRDHITGERIDPDALVLHTTKGGMMFDNKFVPSTPTNETVTKWKKEISESRRKKGKPQKMKKKLVVLIVSNISIIMFQVKISFLKNRRLKQLTMYGIF